MSDRNRMEPHAALQEVERVSRQVRRQARWHGYAWLVVGVLSPVFLIATGTDAFSRETTFWFAIFFMVVGGTLAIWEGRRGVTGRASAAVDRPATWAYVVAMVAVSFVVLAIDFSGTPGWFLGLAVVPAVPALAAAWRILSR